MARFSGWGRVNSIRLRKYVHSHTRPSRVRRSLPSLRVLPVNLMSWLASSRSYFFLLNSTRRQFSFSFRPSFPRDLSIPQRLRNARLRAVEVLGDPLCSWRATSVPETCFGLLLSFKNQRGWFPFGRSQPAAAPNLRLYVSKWPVSRTNEPPRTASNMPRA